MRSVDDIQGLWQANWPNWGVGGYPEAMVKRIGVVGPARSNLESKEGNLCLMQVQKTNILHDLVCHLYGMSMKSENILFLNATCRAAHALDKHAEIKKSQKSARPVDYPDIRMRQIWTPHGEPLFPEFNSIQFNPKSLYCSPLQKSGNESDSKYDEQFYTHQKKFSNISAC